MKTSNLLASIAIGTAATISMAVITPSEADASISPRMEVTGFDLYDPPDRLNHAWYDYTDSQGSPSPGNQITEFPTQYAKYPYRAVFFGAFEDRNHLQGYDSTVFVVFSTKPVLDNFKFEYLESRGFYGHIRATLTGWSDDDVFLVGYNNWGGVSSGQVNVNHWGTARYITYRDPYYFEFDFYYQDCGALQMDGLRNITDVPYGYILTCTDSNGSGGGSQSGSSSSSSGSGGSSSSSGSAGSSSNPAPGVPGGPGSIPSPESSWSDWDQSSSIGSNPDKYPWEDESNDPSKDWNPTIPNYPGGSEGDTGEQGDTWTLPEYSIPDIPFTDNDLNIPPMPDMNWPEVPIPDFNFPDMPQMPDATPPALDYYPEFAGGWPPPFPGTN